MRLSHLADYAVVLMTAAARRPAGERLSATELSADTGVPLPTTQKLMGQLAAAGLLSSARGASGGFALARAAADISLADIVEAVEGPIAMTVCFGHEGPSDCALDAHCRVKRHMGIVGHAVRGALDAVTLEALCAPAKAGVPERATAANAAPWAPAVVYPERPPQADGRRAGERVRS
jgi:FeS assembly SUF system regulator